ncbi:gamma-glutamyltransferase [Bifidobacterium sp.]|jgi:gamma-glutamyltranspeptidase/glutathione hydrolase|uniref:gamma-glutamyltransferase n=1 Tax=Bifidobacterium sp. TaxID=41200 RepID=UPI0025BDD117|nr:gamma-glutamyltransferase [Bifidobacterium sp.]MCH4209944.1 gamma-glutamyltransferase family protein [Bifidobacterium sp.]MCI1225226.1 gamma-glutamyltransferase family protein [Bifidobacterium sp.]
MIRTTSNGQGIVALMALDIRSNFDFKRKEGVETCHRQIEAVKIAFADAFEFMTDPNGRDMDVERYLSSEYGAECSLDPARAARVRQTNAAIARSSPAS